ncbi:hypothetical protein D9M71_253670 [compost metagenome]
MALVPALADRRQHAHGVDHLGIAQVVVGVAGGSEGGVIGFGQRFLRRLLGEIGQAHQDQRADQGEQSQQRVDQVGDQQVDRRPRCIEEREQAIAGEELTNLREILQGLGRITSGAVQVALECSGEDAAVEVHVQAVADPDQHAGADHFQGGHQQEQAYHQHGQHRQRRDVATDQSPIIDLQHVHGGCQHHHVDDTAEPCQRIKTAAQAKERVGQFGAGARLFVHFGHTYPNAGCPCGATADSRLGWLAVETGSK